jgi:hypothetical protein
MVLSDSADKNHGIAMAEQRICSFSRLAAGYWNGLALPWVLPFS